MYPTHETDFMEGMKGIYDALHAEDYGESTVFQQPPFPLPYRGNGLRLAVRRSSSMASRGFDGRQ
jgi:hypothetical protein